MCVCLRVCACVRACVRACVYACVFVCGGVGVKPTSYVSSVARFLQSSCTRL